MTMSFIADPADFPGNIDLINWKDFPFTIIKTPLSGGAGSNVGTSKGGLGFRIDNPSRNKIVRQGQTWDGNFPANESLVYTWKRVGPVMLVFDTPIRGVGACMQEKFGTGTTSGAPFTAIVRAFGSSHNPLPLPSPNPGEVAANSDDGSNFSAVFVGALSDQANIKFVEFDTKAIAAGDLDGDFAIGRVTLVM